MDVLYRYPDALLLLTGLALLSLGRLLRRWGLNSVLG